MPGGGAHVLSKYIFSAGCSLSGPAQANARVLVKKFALQEVLMHCSEQHSPSVVAKDYVRHSLRNMSTVSTAGKHLHQINVKIWPGCQSIGCVHTWLRLTKQGVRHQAMSQATAHIQNVLQYTTFNSGCYWSHCVHVVFHAQCYTHIGTIYIIYNLHNNNNTL